MLRAMDGAGIMAVCKDPQPPLDIPRVMEIAEKFGLEILPRARLEAPSDRPILSCYSVTARRIAAEQGWVSPRPLGSDQQSP